MKGGGSNHYCPPYKEEEMKKGTREEIGQEPDTREENMDERIGRAYKDGRIIDYRSIGINETDKFFIREFRAENFSVFCLCYEQDGLFLTEPDGRYACDYLSYEEAVQAARRIVRCDVNAHLLK